MMTLQQAWRGKWRNVTGTTRDEAEMSAYAARAVERDGYQSFRVADDSTDGVVGAPMRPVHAFVPLPAGETADWLGLVKRQAGLGQALDEDEKKRLQVLLQRMQGDVIGAADDWTTAQAMQREHSEARGGPDRAEDTRSTIGDPGRGPKRLAGDTDVD